MLTINDLETIEDDWMRLGSITLALSKSWQRLLRSGVAVTGLVAHETVAVDSSFNLTLSDAGSDRRQVFVAVNQGDSLGPTFEFSAHDCLRDDR